MNVKKETPLLAAKGSMGGMRGSTGIGERMECLSPYGQGPRNLKYFFPVIVLKGLSGVSSGLKAEEPCPRTSFLFFIQVTG
jgi:hypothetical protein